MSNTETSSSRRYEKPDKYQQERHELTESIERKGTNEVSNEGLPNIHRVQCDSSNANVTNNDGGEVKFELGEEKQTMLEKGEMLLRKPWKYLMYNAIEMILDVTALIVWLFHVKYEQTLWILVCSNVTASFILNMFTIHVEFFRRNVKKTVHSDDTCIYHIPYHWKLLMHLSLIGRTIMLLANITLTSTTNYFSLITTIFLLLHTLHCFLNLNQIYILIQWTNNKE